MLESKALCYSFPVSDDATTFPTYTITVNDVSPLSVLYKLVINNVHQTKPIWAYCRQANHCGQGMVFSVNAVESGPNNFAAFQSKAKELNGTSSKPPSSSGAPHTSTNNYYGGSILTLALLCMALL